MPARVVIVHDDPDLVGPAVTAVILAGFDAMGFTDPIAAIDALDEAEKVELLITQMDFGPGKQTGLSLARMGRYRRPALNVIFATQPEFADADLDIGEIMVLPVKVPDLVDAVRRLLPARDPTR